jgi:hypothetical protein
LNNGEERRREALRFLKRLVEKCDKIAVLADSPFTRKLYSSLMKDGRPESRLASKYLFGMVLSNFEKCIFAEPTREIPQDLADKVPEDDRYLYQLRAELNDGVIVTTDRELGGLPHTRLRTSF